MKRTIIIFASILFSYACFAQRLTLSGKVVDAETKEVLVYATVSLRGTSLVTLTNGDGEFELTVSGRHADDTLAISVMGYASYLMRISDIGSPQKIMAVLKLKPIQLNEVIVSENKIKAEDIVRKAFENVENNFPTTSYKLNGFYRELHLEDNKAVKLIEASIDVYDLGYVSIKGRPRTREKINLNNVRGSKNYRHGCFSHSVVERYNLVVGALTHNPIRYRNPSTKQWMRGKKFIMDTVMYMNDRPAYVVSFLSYISGYPNFERKNTIYIDAENYSIYKYTWEEYARKGKYSEKSWRLTPESKYLTNRKRISTIYEFGNYKGKMFLKYFDEKCYDDIIDSTSDSVVFESFGDVTLIIGQVETENITFPKEETIKRDQSLATQIKPYDPAFWNNLEQIKQVPLTKKNVKDLEREMTLEQQFRIEGMQR